MSQGADDEMVAVAFSFDLVHGDIGIIFQNIPDNKPFCMRLPISFRNFGWTFVFSETNKELNGKTVVLHSDFDILLETMNIGSLKTMVTSLGKVASCI